MNTKFPSTKVFSLFTPTNPTLTGILLAISSALFFGIGGPVTKTLSSAGMTALQITQSIMTLAALLLLLLVLVKYPKQLLVVRSEWPMLISFGLISFCTNQFLYTIAVSRVPVGIALLLEYLAPVIIILWIKFVRKTPLPPAIWVGILSVLIGLFMVGEVWAGFHLDTIGVIAGLGTAIALAARFLLSEHGLKTHKALVLTALGTSVGAVALNVVSPLTSFPWQTVMHDVAIIGDVSTPLWMLLIWLSVVSTVLAYLAGINAQRYLAPAAISQIATLEVIFAATFAALLLNETLSFVQVIGATIMLVGILLAQLMVARYKFRKNNVQKG